MTAVVVTVDEFFTFFPEFSAVDEAVIQSYLNQAQLYLSPDSNTLDTDTLKLSIYLMCAHLLATSGVAGIPANLLGSATTGLTNSMSVDGVSVSFQQAPIGTSQSAWWLNKTQYGQRLLMLLDSSFICHVVGGKFTRIY